MRRHFFWLAVALAAAVTAHVGFLLYAPASLLGYGLKRMTAGHGPNAFFILREADQAALFPGLPRDDVVGACLFDVSRGSVTFNADLPQGMWVATIYTDRAEPIYSVNDRQSGASKFSVSLSLAPGLIETLLQATGKEQPEIDSGWTVMSPRPQGLVVVWYPVAEAAMRSAIAQTVQRSNCRAEAPAQQAAQYQ